MRHSRSALSPVLFLLISLGRLEAAPGFNTITIQDTHTVDATNKRYLTAVPAVDAPVIDGRLDDAFWQNVPFQSKFVQREPIEGAPASEKTAVAVGFDADNLYLAIRCFDSEPDKIIAREMRRDAMVDDDDFVEIVLDTYHDHRSGFYFIMNPNGVRRDAMLADEGRQYNPAWDGVWQCRTQVNEEGWQLEIALPLKTLRFAEGDNATWGINIARMIRRKNEHVYWQLIPRELGHTNIFRLSEAGNLQGLTDLHMGGNVEIQPYVMGGLQHDADSGNDLKTTGDLGLDAKVALTGNLSMDITLNTDFAQVESDQEQVNLSRFSLYFPEKREFFLEGAEIFNFGGSRGWRGGGEMNFFYSRRIGIEDGMEQRILGGAKVVGKIGNVQTGFLNMVTDENTVDDGDSSYTNPAANYTVLRLKRDLFQRGAIGLMATSKADLKGDDFNRALGVDAYLPLGRHTTLIGYLAGTQNQDETLSGRLLSADRNLAANLSLEYRTDRWAFSSSYASIGEHFNPEVGFVRRLGYRNTKASASFSPRPDLAAIRQLTYSVSGRYRTGHDGTMLDRGVSASWGVQFENSSRFSLGISRGEEYLDFDWEVRDGYLIPMANYAQWRYSASFRSDPSRRISGMVYTGFGDYFTGSNWSLNTSANITLIPKTRFELSYRHNTVSLPRGDFDTNTYGIRAFYFFSTELYVKAYMQLNDDRLAYDGREKTVANIMLRWIYSPGSNFFLVYNDGRLRGPGSDDILNRALMAKATFFWRR